MLLPPPIEGLLTPSFILFISFMETLYSLPVLSILPVDSASCRPRNDLALKLAGFSLWGTLKFALMYFLIAGRDEPFFARRSETALNTISSNDGHLFVLGSCKRRFSLYISSPSALQLRLGRSRCVLLINKQE